MSLQVQGSFLRYAFQSVSNVCQLNHLTEGPGDVTGTIISVSPGSIVLDIIATSPYQATFLSLRVLDPQRPESKGKLNSFAHVVDVASPESLVDDENGKIKIVTCKLSVRHTWCYILGNVQRLRWHVPANYPKLTPLLQ